MSLNEQQTRAIEQLKKGKNVLLIGQAGTGKSKLLKDLSSLLPGRSVYITSTTGISALNIGGVTLHSFLGLELLLEKRVKACNLQENTYSAFKLKIKNLLLL